MSHVDVPYVHYNSHGLFQTAPREYMPTEGLVEPDLLSRNEKFHLSCEDACARTVEFSFFFKWVPKSKSLKIRV